MNNTTQQPKKFNGKIKINWTTGKQKDFDKAMSLYEKATTYFNEDKIDFSYNVRKTK